MKILICINRATAIIVRITILFMILFTAVKAVAQNDSSYKNTVRFNITNPMIFGWESLIVGYEMQLENNQSFSVNLGRASFPGLAFSGVDSLQLISYKDFTDHGLNVSMDYRFYSKNLNKYAAPRGVYVGPYYSYNYFSRTCTWHLNTVNFQGYVQSDLLLNIHSVGFELGYQYVFWNRLSVDLILIGPGIGYYSIKTKFDSTLDAEDQQIIFDALNELLSARFPGYNRIIDGEDFKKTGTIKTLDLGFRYMINIGFRF